ncbi:MAG TPA: hypothetical protein VHO48_11330 [Anaerolineaceae bacterium]|nr:hypothetical protein [Anaerolineaceae bacterium]
MVTICCTSKLLKRAGFPVESSVPEPTTALGNSYANILFFHRRQILLFVSERSRLAVIAPAKDTRLLANHLPRSLSVLLERLNAKPEWIDAEIRQMADVHYAPTGSRSVLGTMNDYKFQIEALLSRSLEESEIAIALHLSVCPAGPLEYRSPDRVTLDLLKTRYEAI